MARYVLGINPTTEATGTHDPSAVIFEDGTLVFGAEEERYIREKHAERTFPTQAIEACLDYCDIDLSELETVTVGWEPKKKAKYDAQIDLQKPSLREKAYRTVENLKDYSVSISRIRTELSQLGSPLPPVETVNHHRSHAASAFAPSGFDEALIVTVDGRGERDATVVWKAEGQELQRVRTYDFPNSLGAFYGTVTGYLGYRINNGEGKVMGLAPYGSHNPDIESRLLDLVEPGVDYDVSALNFYTGQAVSKLEETLDRPRKAEGGEFSEWEQDLAFTAQRFLEETIVDIVSTYCTELGINNVALAGGVALNCKMNKQVMELDVVDDVFIQPVAHDAGCAIGAAILTTGRMNSNDMSTVYWGPEYSTAQIKDQLEQFKIRFTEPDNVERATAERLASGDLVGWFQGRMEMGPRALGNRSIIADSRTVDSRDRVNKFVKHREEWRPFAPSLLEEAADEYLINAEPAPYMIKTFDVRPEKKDEIPAVLHAGDETTRPQTVREDQNPRYYRLLREFESLTGVPVLLNTSFNDHGEPIINTPKEAIKDFFAMGLDVLVLEDVMIEKQ